jgi:hypothetical protein
MVDQNSDHFIVAVLKCQHEKGICRRHGLCHHRDVESAENTYWWTHTGVCSKLKAKTGSKAQTKFATDTHGDYIYHHGPGVFVAKRTKSLLKLDFLWSPL